VEVQYIVTVLPSREALIITIFLDLLGPILEDLEGQGNELYFVLYTEGILDAIVDTKTTYYTTIRNDIVYPITIIKGQRIGYIVQYSIVCCVALTGLNIVPV
jgi:hypothetical protein